MTCFAYYPSPVGRITLVSDGEALTGVYFAGQKYAPSPLPDRWEARPELPLFLAAAAWLDAYFAEEPLPPLPPLRPAGTAFQKAVWAALGSVPYGCVMTYGALAKRLEWDGIYTSPRAVGGAVGKNPIAIFLPCHRIIGADGSLTGYAGGLEIKRFLLELEAETEDPETMQP